MIDPHMEGELQKLRLIAELYPDNAVRDAAKAWREELGIEAVDYATGHIMPIPGKPLYYAKIYDELREIVCNTNMPEQAKRLAEERLENAGLQAVEWHIQEGNCGPLGKIARDHQAPATVREAAKKGFAVVELGQIQRMKHQHGGLPQIWDLFHRAENIEAPETIRKTAGLIGVQKYIETGDYKELLRQAENTKLLPEVREAAKNGAIGAVQNAVGERLHRGGTYDYCVILDIANDARLPETARNIAKEALRGEEAKYYLGLCVKWTEIEKRVKNNDLPLPQMLRNNAATAKLPGATNNQERRKI